MSATNAPPLPAGLRVYFVGHSFHMFIVRPLIYLAKEVGITGHWAEGWTSSAARRPAMTLTSMFVLTNVRGC